MFSGRDDQRADVILLASFTDAFRQSTMVFTEQTGLEKLYGMLSYAFDVTRCRRDVIAQHFGERWQQQQCSAMCDHCSADVTGQSHSPEVSICGCGSGGDESNCIEILYMYCLGKS